MITVRVECSVPSKQGGMIESCPKVYIFDTQALADKFVEDVNSLPQHPDAGNFLHARPVQETAYLTQDAKPLILHDIGLTDYEEGKPREIEYHTTSLYTVAEIEDFRNTGQHPAIVYAYDNPMCIKQAAFTEEEFSESADGGNYFFGDPDWTIFLSFNPEIVNMLKKEYSIL